VPLVRLHPSLVLSAPVLAEQGNQGRADRYRPALTPLGAGADALLAVLALADGVADVDHAPVEVHVRPCERPELDGAHPSRQGDVPERPVEHWSCTVARKRRACSAVQTVVSSRRLRAPERLCGQTS
jgi:hypothetical protein